MVSRGYDNLYIIYFSEKSGCLFILLINVLYSEFLILMRIDSYTIYNIPSNYQITHIIGYSLLFFIPIISVDPLYKPSEGIF